MRTRGEGARGTWGISRSIPEGLTAKLDLVGKASICQGEKKEREMQRSRGREEWKQRAPCADRLGSLMQGRHIPGLRTPLKRTGKIQHTVLRAYHVLDTV